MKTSPLRVELSEQLTALASFAQQELDSTHLETPTAADLPAIEVGVFAAATAGALLEQTCSRGVVLSKEALIAFEGLTRSALRLLPALAGAQLGQLEAWSKEKPGTFDELQLLAADATARLHRGLDLAYRGFFAVEVAS